MPPPRCRTVLHPGAEVPIIIRSFGPLHIRRYYAEEELLAARSTSADTADTADTAVLADGEPSRLESKIAKEIAAMQSRYGGVATVSKKAPTEGITGGGGAGESGACGESRNAPDQETAREEENEGRGSGAEGSGRTEPAADMGIPHCVGAWAQSADGCSWQLQVHVPLAGQHSAADMDLNLDPLRGVLELTPAPAIPPTSATRSVGLRPSVDLLSRAERSSIHAYADPHESRFPVSFPQEYSFQDCHLRGSALLMAAAGGRQHTLRRQQ